MPDAMNPETNGSNDYRTASQDADGGMNPDYQTANTAERGLPKFAIPRHALRAALEMAENAVNEIVSRIRSAEQERDQLARRIGVQQDQIDRLNGEREYRSRLVRDLTAGEV